ncbi:hypothetical protein Q7C23_22740 [Flavobacterium sp. LAR06]
MNQIAKKMNSFKIISEFKTPVFWFEVDKKKYSKNGGN